MDYNLALTLCQGRGLEIGALSNPLPVAADVIYADVSDKREMSALLCSLGGGPYYDLEKLVEPSIILQPPHFFIPIANGELDFVYSSHVMEHTPNILAAIYDQLRCVKTGGIVYFIVPNRRGMYDLRRPATPVATLIRRFEQRVFSFSLEEASELLWGTTDHPHYEPKTAERLQQLHREGPGVHHMVVFTPTSLLDLVRYAGGKFNCELLYFCAAEPVNMHVCLRKLGDSAL